MADQFSNDSVNLVKNQYLCYFHLMLPEKYYYLKVAQSGDLKDKKERKLYRRLEMLPAILAWGTLISLAGFSWLAPFEVAIFVISFDIYWLIKTIYLALHLRTSYKKVTENIKTDWIKKLNNLAKKDYAHPVGDWHDLYHLVIFPAYKEPYEIIKPSLDALVNERYPKDRFIVVFAVEERAMEYARDISEKIKQEYGDKFGKFLISMHPKDLVGDVPGKGSNIAYAGRKAKELIDGLKIPHENIIVSAFDIDTVIHHGYFACLTHSFLTTKNPLRSSYQPVPFYINNIWEAPSFARIFAFSSTFWHMMQQERSEKMTTFSSHSMSFKALIDVDFWQPNMVSEDSRIFWQCFLRYDGDYKIRSLYFPVNMDANVAETTGQTAVNQYRQVRRWGWGAENIPYFLFGFWKNKRIPMVDKWHYSFFIIEGFHSWATNALAMFVFGWLPLVLGGEVFNSSLIAYNLPRITRIIMILAMFGLVTSAVMAINLLPVRPVKYGRSKYVWIVLQWVLLPFTIIIFGALPGLESQTRLFLSGKYRLGFWVTPKTRKI